MRKYEFTGEVKSFFGRTLHQIKAAIKFGEVEVDEIGGWIEKEENLSHEGDAWVSGDAQVSGDARVYGNAQVSGNAQVYGNARVYGDAQVSGDARVYGNAQVSGDAWVYGDARVYGNAWVYGDAQVSGDARVYGDAQVSGDARVYGNAQVFKTSHYFVVGPCGSRFAFTTFFRTKNKVIFVKCGCFLGSLGDFITKVKETHGDNKHAQVYLAAAELANLQIDMDEYEAYRGDKE